MKIYVLFNIILKLILCVNIKKYKNVYDKIEITKVNIFYF